MKKKFFFFGLLLFNFLFSQNNQKLFYFVSKDSLVGVKNDKDEIIIPAEFINFEGIKNGEIIKDKYIYFNGHSKIIPCEKNSWGIYFDKNGNYLYQAFAYDNGSDYFEEGYQRFVKNGKVGFVDRNANVVIEPKYDFATPFNYGYASYCNGCDWEKTNDEHKSIVGGTWGIINFKGEEVLPLIKKTSEKDVEIEGESYPYPFIYNEKENIILIFFRNQNKLLSDLYYVNHYPKLESHQKKLIFEIVERPKEDYPYYQINTYDFKYEKANDFNFLVSMDAKEILHIDFFGEKLFFKKWLKNEIKDAIQFQKTHSDNPNKFIQK